MLSALSITKGEWVEADTEEEYQSMCMEILSRLGEEGSPDESALRQIDSGANSIIYVPKNETQALKNSRRRYVRKYNQRGIYSHFSRAKLIFYNWTNVFSLQKLCG